MDTTWSAASKMGGEAAAGELASELGSDSERARDMAYRLYAIAERKKRAQDALQYNALVQSWPEIMRLAAERAMGPAEVQAGLFDGTET